MKKLIVAETFYSLQCEGRAIGTPAVFLRLGGCNLMCNSEHWRCDTIEVWQKGKATDFADVLSNEMMEHLNEGAHLVITGGEPLIHQYNINGYLIWLLHKHNLKPFVEIETNGTILPNCFLEKNVEYWNVSPKLSNCGELADKRINEAALRCLAKLDSIFKFVIASEGDITEAFQDFEEVPHNKMMFMPAGATREELDKTRLIAVEACKKYHVRYSERLHIVIWNKKTGV